MPSLKRKQKPNLSDGLHRVNQSSQSIDLPRSLWSTIMGALANHIGYLRKDSDKSYESDKSDIASESYESDCYNKSTSGAVKPSTSDAITSGCTRGHLKCKYCYDTGYDSSGYECECINSDNESASSQCTEGQNKHCWAGPCVVIGCYEQASDTGLQLSADTGYTTGVTVRGTTASTTLAGYIRLKAY